MSLIEYILGGATVGGGTLGSVAATKIAKIAVREAAKAAGKSILKLGAKAVLKAALSAIVASPWFWVALGVGVVVGGVVGYIMYKNNQKAQQLSEELPVIGQQMTQDAMETAGANTAVQPGVGENQSIAYGNSGLGDAGLNEEAKKALAASTQGITNVGQPPTAEQIQQAVNTKGLQSQQEAMDRFNEMLAQLNQGSTPEDIMGALQEINKIDNPLSDTIGENDDDIEDVVEEEIEKYEEELDFDKGDFDDLEGYKFMINNTLVTLYVKSDITLISEDENFQNITNSGITSEKYTDKKGQTHAVSKAYDADGNKLDNVIMSTQIGYLEVGLDGVNGTAKFSGSGNEDAYEVHGYGQTSFGKKEYEVSIVGSYDLKNNEKEKEALLGTNSDIIANKEYKFRDDGAIELTESETNALFDTFTASIKWACDVMREVNLQSYVLDLGEAEFILGENKDEDTDKIEIEENGITYTFNANATITNPETGATYLVKDLLDQKITTMEELIEKGFEPNTINGKEYEDEEDLKEAITETKPKFTIKIDEPTTQENFEKETFYFDEDGTRYYFETKRSHRYHIITEDGQEYTIEEALEIYTIDELIANGLDCKIAAC